MPPEGASRTPTRRRPPHSRHGVALVDRWLQDWRRIMRDYPELCIDAINRAELEAERYVNSGASGGDDAA
jgi:hypothetical protein